MIGEGLFQTFKSIDQIDIEFKDQLKKDLLTYYGIDLDQTFKDASKEERLYILFFSKKSNRPLGFTSCQVLGARLQDPSTSKDSWPIKVLKTFKLKEQSKLNYQALWHIPGLDQSVLAWEEGPQIIEATFEKVMEYLLHIHHITKHFNLPHLSSQDLLRNEAI